MRVVEPARLEPALRTIERLESGQATGKVYGQVLAAVAPTIRDIEIFEDGLMDLVETTPMPRLRGLRVMHWKRKPYEDRFAQRVVPWLEAHPAVGSRFARFVMQHFAGAVRSVFGRS